MSDVYVHGWPVTTRLKLKFNFVWSKGPDYSIAGKFGGRKFFMIRWEARIYGENFHGHNIAPFP